MDTPCPVLQTCRTKLSCLAGIACLDMVSSHAGWQGAAVETAGQWRNHSTGGSPNLIYSSYGGIGWTCHACDAFDSTVGLLGREPRLREAGLSASVNASLLVVLPCVNRLSSLSGAWSPRGPLRMLPMLRLRLPIPLSLSSSDTCPLAAAAANELGLASLLEGPALLPFAAACSLAGV